MTRSKISFGEVIALTLTMTFAILSLAPAQVAAMRAAKQMDIKNKGRAVWLHIVSANTEREILDLTPLWPGDLHEAKVKKFDSAEAYFLFLLSDGDGEKIAPLPDRIVSDFQPEMLVDDDIEAAKGPELPPEANMWHVVCVNDGMEAEVPFLITRNVKASDIRYPDEAQLMNPEKSGRVALKEGIKPLGAERAVWVTRGGSVQEAAVGELTVARICPVAKGEESETTLKVLPAQNGYH